VNGVNGMTKIDTLTATASRHAAHFFADESGATAIEYAMVASGIGAFLAATVYTLGGNVKDMFTTLASLFPS
jgi:pilus assembly protein Flp/PilA